MTAITDRIPTPPAAAGGKPSTAPGEPVLARREPFSLSETEFRRLQETDGSVRGYELENGRLVPMPPVYGSQGRAWGRLYRGLANFVEERSLGEVLLDQATYLGPGERRRYFPDIVYLSNEDLGRFDGEQVTGPPTMVCEVANATSWDRDHGEKSRAYFEAGVPWYWIVDLVEGQTKEYRRGGGGYELVSLTPLDQPFRPRLFPGLETVVAPPAAGTSSTG